MKRLLLLPILFIAACTSASLTITNSSDFAITEMHVTDVNNPSWGPNLLAGNELLPGEHATVDTTCGTYDVMLVDETGVSCEVDSIDLCANSSDFVITNNTCAAFREAAASKITAPTTTRD
jgi:hypothetical protein